MLYHELLRGEKLQGMQSLRRALIYLANDRHGSGTTSDHSVVTAAVLLCVRSWVQQYDSLKKHSLQKTELELLDEASRRRGRMNRFGRPVKVSGDILNEMAEGPPPECEKSVKHWMEKSNASRSCVKRAKKQIAKRCTVENRPSIQESESAESSQS
jgi:hypothetical protein